MLPPDELDRWDLAWRRLVRRHWLLLLPPVLAAVFVLVKSDRIWTERGESRYGPGTIVAHSVLGAVAFLVVLYAVVPLVNLLPYVPPAFRPAPRTPTEAELGCVPVLLRGLVLLALYFLGWGLLRRYG